MDELVYLGMDIASKRQRPWIRNVVGQSCRDLTQQMYLGRVPGELGLERLFLALFHDNNEICVSHELRIHDPRSVTRNVQPQIAGAADRRLGSRHAVRRPCARAGDLAAGIKLAGHQFLPEASLRNG